MSEKGEPSCLGNCPPDKPCSEVKVGDNIDPLSRAHVERNACNRCPRGEPEPKYVWIKTVDEFGQGEAKVFAGYYVDDEDNQWIDDYQIAAGGEDGHGDTWDGERQTYRIKKAKNGGRGWQWTYQNGVLDDVSRQMGTFDYANHPLGQGFHKSMDRDPHAINSNYVPNLTQTFGS